MAAAAPFLSADGYTCSVCLEVLKEPVTIPCGHSFCLECINSYWDRSGLMETYRCPQCRMEFHSRPQLHKNTTLMNLIEKLKETAAIRGPPQGTAGRNDVLCDFCPVRKRRASKTCLTCTASYCKIHLQPHLDSAAFMRHKLLEPTGNLKEKLCSKHQKVLDMFCRTDKSRICLLCAVTEHNSHNVRMLDKETTERKRTAETAVRDFEETFAPILILWSVGLNLIRDLEDRELHKAERLMMQLEQEIRKLRRTHAELAELSETDDHIHFLQMYSSVSPPPEDQDSPEASVNELVLPGSLRTNLSDLKRKLREINFCPLTFDPNTANAWLRLSERNKKVISQGIVSPCPDHPDRFDWWFQVLCEEALSGTRCYWEVNWSGEGAAMGVTYKGIRRQGNGYECRLGFNDQSWILSCSRLSCSVWHNETKTEISVPSSQRIGLHLDYTAGSLSFYSVSDTMTLIHRFNATFTEPLYAGFWVGQRSSVTICPL
ncbi:TRI16 protein, partial [Polypterus senegalus]